MSKSTPKSSSTSIKKDPYNRMAVEMPVLPSIYHLKNIPELKDIGDASQVPSLSFKLGMHSAYDISSKVDASELGSAHSSKKKANGKLKTTHLPKLPSPLPDTEGNPTVWGIPTLPKILGVSNVSMLSDIVDILSEPKTLGGLCDSNIPLAKDIDLSKTPGVIIPGKAPVDNDVLPSNKELTEVPSAKLQTPNGEQDISCLPQGAETTEAKQKRGIIIPDIETEKLLSASSQLSLGAFPAGNKHYANNRSLCHQKSTHKSIASAPDVCKTPQGSATPPVPYSITSESKDADQYSSSVFIQGAPTALANSVHTKCTGDEAGAAKGVVSGTSADMTQFTSYSFDVKCEGEGMVRHQDTTLMNKGNTTGQMMGESAEPP